jgi:glutaminyl-peptide cyclotransferase
MMTRPWISVVVASLLLSCGSENAEVRAPKDTQRSQSAQRTFSAERHRYRLIRKVPHDTTAFTQGLTVHEGAFLESTGLTGRSGIRRVEIATGKVIARNDYTFQYFGEGLCVLGNEIYAVTWLNQTGFVLDAATLKQKRTFSYMGEGWGLTTDGTSLYMSNGTSQISRRNPADFQQIGVIDVTLDGRPLHDLNELEWIEGEIWANVWKREQIVRIDPATGVVQAVVDLSGILPIPERPMNADVLNGIAYDPATKALYVTGKNWPWVYQIEVD